MVYKRKAHVLFVGNGDPSRALIAAAFANVLGLHFMRARAVELQRMPCLPQLSSIMHEVGLDVSNPRLYLLYRDNIAWADLVVALDVAAAAACPVLPTWVQKRCYPFAPPEDIESLRRVRDAIQQRVAGMVGGMAFMAAFDERNICVR